jgi:hypothetical protein
MLIVWIKKHQDAARTANEADKMSRHNADMKRFRAAHPDWDLADARDIVTADGNLLAMVSGARLAPHSQN